MTVAPDAPLDGGDRIERRHKPDEFVDDLHTFRPRIRRPEAEAPLPAWPLAWMIAGYPAWFLLGMTGFTWIIFAAPMAASLVRRRNLVAPRGFILYVIFLCWMLGSVVQVNAFSRLAGFGLRAGYYVAAGVFCLYVLNAGRSIPVERIVRWFTMLYMSVIFGGYLAFILGDFSYLSPIGYLMPGALAENELIRALINPTFAQVQDFIGFPVPRPTAPFQYTNGWGASTALLTPFAMVALSDRRVGLNPTLVRFTLGASIVPIVVSMNRGLWLSLGLGLMYVAVRSGLAGQNKLLGALLAGFVALGAIYAFTPLGDLVSERLATGHSDDDRGDLATGAIEGAIESPLLGYGTPRTLTEGKLPIGTHGQAWNLMFSHGFIAFFSYVGFMGMLAWNSRRLIDAKGVWLHTVVIIGLVQMPFYLHLPQQLFFIVAGGTLAVRLAGAVDPPERRLEPTV